MLPLACDQQTPVWASYTCPAVHAACACGAVTNGADISAVPQSAPIKNPGAVIRIFMSMLLRR
jgi:hypothetical protein